MAINTVINTNMMALTSHRALSSVGNRQAKASQRLSTGKKINSAADDAAGLAISEKMKAQIKGLDMASKNSQDAISLIQTAEGALTEVNDMLTRVRELTVQAANDTNQQEDRVKIAEEVGTLLTEIDSISGRTEFNEKKLNDGSFQDGFFQIGANKGQKLNLGIDNMSVFGIGAKDVMNAFGLEKSVELNTESSAAGVVSDGVNSKVTTAAVAGQAGQDNTGGVLTIEVKNNVTGVTETLNFDFKANIAQSTAVKDVAAKVAAGLENNKDFSSKYSISSTTDGKLVIESKEEGGEFVITKAGLSLTNDAGAADTGAKIASTAIGNGDVVNGYHNKLDLSKLQDGDTITIAGKKFTKTAAGKEGDSTNGFSSTTGLAKLLEKDGIFLDKDGKGTAATDGDTTVYLTKVDSQNSALAGKYTVNSKKVSDKGADYSKTIETVDKALKTVTTQRSKLGANQNRLEHTINNLSLSSENLSAAKSRIEDTDMAKEMMNLTSANVLQQAATSMLAQANQAPNKITQLLG